MEFWRRQRQPGGLFTYKGRVNRKKYITVCIILFILSTLSIFLVKSTTNMFIGITFLLLNMAFFVLQALNFAKRLHDLDYSSWLAVLYVLLAVLIVGGYQLVIDIIRAFWEICLAIKKGTEGPNQYGADPLQQEASEET